MIVFFYLSFKVGLLFCVYLFFFFFQAEDGIRDHCVTGVQTCALPIYKTLQIARRVGERVARPVRDAQRISEVTQRWDQMWAELVASGEAADRRLDHVARQIAADARAVDRKSVV